MNSMKTLLNEDQRLVLLRSIVECGGDANESILQSCLDAYGHRISRDLVKSHLCWLDEQGLITRTDINGLIVARITGRGEDVAEGRIKVDGVKKPRARG